MFQNEFFEEVEVHLKLDLPFVVYRKPKQLKVNAFLQQSVEIYYSKAFNEVGFVFAPFDASEKTILFPLEHSKQLGSDVIVEIQNAKSSCSNNNDEVKEFHKTLVKKGIEHIQSNQFSKVVLSRCESVAHESENPLHVFKTLLATYADAFVYCWYHPKIGLWLGATPETLIHLRGNRFKTMSLAGTQEFNGKVDVEWSSKELQEQQYVTDHIKSCLVSESDNFQITEAKTSRAGHLLHLKSEISGLLKTDLKSILTKLHPTPAVCGLPVESSKAFILEHESYNREFYSGFLGEINCMETKSRNANKRNVENNAYGSIIKISHLFVNLRCMQYFNDEALIYVGGGITSDSNPENEWQETVSKAKTIRKVLY